MGSQEAEDWHNLFPDSQAGLWRKFVIRNQVPWNLTACFRPGSATSQCVAFGNAVIYTSVWASLVAQRLKCPPPMRETRVRSLGQKDPLEKEMVTHSSILAWRIPWMEKPGRLQSTGSQRVGHNWATSLHFTSSLTSVWGECNCAVKFEHSLALPFFGIGMKTDLFQSCGHCCFPNLLAY